MSYSKQEKGDPYHLKEIDESNDWYLGELGAGYWKGTENDLVCENDILKWS